MIATVEKFVRAFERHRDRPPAELLKKLRRSALALAKARLNLRACSSVGPRARTFGSKPDIDNRGTIRLGADFSLSCTFGTVQLATAEKGVIEVGDGVSINYGTSISARTMVRIGDQSKIGPYCVIMDGELPLPLELPDADAPAAVEIGKNVWLGGRVTVMPGSRIGDGAVVSAGSVVVGDIPANAIASGNPARVLRVSAAPPPSGARLRSVNPETGPTVGGEENIDVAAVG